jgi:chloramphenicol 3-O-phosphotransferase
MAEITQVLDSTPDRAEAEKIVVVKYAPMMDEAMRESKRCLNEWLETIKVDGGEELE